MSKWTHALCEACWNANNPGREAVRIGEEFLDETADPCCFCGKPQQSGIFIRRDPVGLRCGGYHAEDDD